MGALLLLMFHWSGRVPEGPEAFNTMMTHTAAGCAAGLVLPARAPSHPTLLSPRALNSLRLGSFVGMFTSLEHGMMYARGEADVFNSSFSGLVTGSCFAAASAASRNGQTIGRYGAIGCMLGTGAGMLSMAAKAAIDYTAQQVQEEAAESGAASSSGPSEQMVMDQQNNKMAATTKALEQQLEQSMQLEKQMNKLKDP